MNLRPAHSDSSWRFEWSTPAGHQLALRYVSGREEWQRLARVADPVTGECGGWGPHQLVDLPAPADEDEARATVEKYAAGRKP